MKLVHSYICSSRLGEQDLGTAGQSVPAYPPQAGRPTARTTFARQTAAPAEAYPETHLSAADAFHIGGQAGAQPGPVLGSDSGYAGFHPLGGQPTGFGPHSGYTPDGNYDPTAGPTACTICGQDADTGGGRPMFDEKVARQTVSVLD